MKYESRTAVGNGAPILAIVLPTLAKTLLFVATSTGFSPTLISIGLSAAYCFISACVATSPFAVSNAPTSLFHLKFVSSIFGPITS